MGYKLDEGPTARVCSIVPPGHQDTARSWFGAVCSQNAQVLGLLGALLGVFLGHIAELEGTKGLIETGN